MSNAAVATVTFLDPSSTGTPGGSIQSQQQGKASAGRAPADRSQIAQYLTTASDEVVECRERARHMFPATRRHRMTFTGMTDNGLFILRKRCGCCGLVDRVEFWEITEVKRRRGVTDDVECRMVFALNDYSVRGPNGEKYQNDPGQGRMPTSVLRQVLAAEALRATGLTLRELERAAKAAGERAAAQ